jgi:hypothetical protein
MNSIIRLIFVAQTWVGPRAGLNAVEKRIVSFLCWEKNSGRPARSLVAIPTELPRLHLSMFYNLH